MTVEQYQEKLALLRTDPDKYYEQYPDEKPAASGDPAEGGSDLAASGDPAEGGSNPGAMVYQHNGHKYDGMTLNQIHTVDPFFAQQVYNDHLDSERQAEANKQSQVNEAATEIKGFATDIKNELFGENVADLTESQAEQISSVVDSCLKFIKESGRTSNLKDAYYLMNRDRDLANAAGKAAEGIAASLDKGSSQARVRTAQDGGDAAGWGAYEVMDSGQLESAVDNMTDEEVARFLKDAPPSLKNKHPTVPWD